MILKFIGRVGSRKSGSVPSLLREPSASSNERKSLRQRKLEVLRLACVGQPREMMNLICAPMKSVTTAQRIEKALDRLRQRYGVLSGLTSKPRVIAIRHGAKVNFTASSLKMYNEDLNTLEVFAYAHDEYNKLFGQLLLDTANC